MYASELKNRRKCKTAAGWYRQQKLPPVVAAPRWNQLLRWWQLPGGSSTSQQLSQWKLTRPIPAVLQSSNAAFQCCVAGDDGMAAHKASRGRGNSTDKSADNRSNFPTKDEMTTSCCLCRMTVAGLLHRPLQAQAAVVAGDAATCCIATTSSEVAAAQAAAQTNLMQQTTAQERRCRLTGNSNRARFRWLQQRWCWQAWQDKRKHRRDLRHLRYVSNHCRQVGGQCCRVQCRCRIFSWSPVWF